MSFAPEIIGQILSFVGEDVPSIKACTLISPIWCSVAQPLLFSEIYTDTRPLMPGSARNPEDLASTLARSPHLARSVVKYRLVGDVRSPGKAALDITSTLTQLRHLEFSANENANLHPQLTSAFPAILSSTRLTSLRLFGICDFPAEAFQHCIVLQHLVLQYTTLTGLDGLLIARSPKVQLHTFSFATCALASSGSREREAFEWFMEPSCSFDVSKLQVFLSSDTAQDPRSSELFNQFVSKFPRSLGRVLIAPCPRFPTSVSPPLQLVCLHTLEIPFTVEPTDGVSWTVNFLSNLTAPSLLRRVVLHYERPRFFDALVGLAPMDTCLSSEAFQSLEGVTVVIYTRAFVMTITSRFRNVFHSLEAKKMLTVTNYDVVHYADIISGPLPG
ncbi:hypothetical protein BDN72DRAFT_959066 [Pluteus cervinus]|uniref:Uncharacterized protein n=1 Tax=Pluteus cervinus TaxID=181527 RepID=A0ACD3AXZ6_9AGAR|nr:hypothetical protein BDN72DRAFT_959066 [Pluteus cervinus]